MAKHLLELFDDDRLIWSRKDGDALIGVVVDDEAYGKVVGIRLGDPTKEKEVGFNPRGVWLEEAEVYEMIDALLSALDDVRRRRRKEEAE